MENSTNQQASLELQLELLQQRLPQDLEVLDNLVQVQEDFEKVTIKIKNWQYKADETLENFHSERQMLGQKLADLENQQSEQKIIGDRLASIDNQITENKCKLSEIKTQLAEVQQKQIELQNQLADFKKFQQNMIERVLPNFYQRFDNINSTNTLTVAQQSTKCRHEGNPPGSKFCSKCGEAIS